MATAATDDTATDDPPDVPEDSEAEAQAAQAAASRMKKIKAGGLVGILTVVMMGIGYVFMPAASPDSEEVAPAQATVDDGPLDENTGEVEIGKFNCTNARAGIDVSVHVNFSLYAVTQNSNIQSLKDAKEKYEARIRDAVNSIARSASRDDLNDPRLDTIKRKIREEINRIIHEHYIIEIMIPDWQTMER